MILYGFLHTESLQLFKQLINVNGVGPKYALAILTAMSADQVILAIASEDKKALTKVPGIGAKTAGRIILDLKDKISFSGNTQPAGGDGEGAPAAGEPAQEAIAALIALGYAQAEAASAVSKVYQPDLTLEEIIKRSLKQLI